VSQNIFDLGMIPDASLDLVYMSHVLEHVPRSKLAATILEMARVLKAGGTLRLSVPDFDHIVHIYEQTGHDLGFHRAAAHGRPGLRIQLSLQHL
jgi:Uncharacterized protein conserved in bacteria